MFLDKDKLSIALDNIGSNYRKILLVNLTTDTFQAVTISDDEKPFLQSNKISEYWQWFCGSGLIHNDDKDACIAFAKSVKPNTHIVYRRKLNNAWHWVLMELIPARDYSDSNKSCVLYVRDINNIYIPEYESIVEKLGTKDSFTGMYNKFAFERDKERFMGESIGVIFCDLNGLKYTNDKYGHKAGDELILKFANLLSINFPGYKCYHLSGDEFVVCSNGKSVREFINKAIVFHKSVWVSMDIPISSVGYSVGEAGEFNMVLEDAEKAMYDDKRIFYSKFPQYKRK